LQRKSLLEARRKACAGETFFTDVKPARLGKCSAIIAILNCIELKLLLDGSACLQQPTSKGW